MFRTTKYCDRREYVPFNLDTPITIPGVNTAQNKVGYSFTIGNISTYYDWYKAYLKIKFKVVKNDNTNFAANDRIAPINDATSFISNLRITLNGKSIYDSINTYRITNVKSLLTKSLDYTRSTATREFYYPDENRTTVIDKDDDDYNKGFHTRQSSIVGGEEVDAIIPLNKFSFFEGLITNILPPTQTKLEIRLNDDDTLLYRNAGVHDGKIIVTKLVLWLPKLNLNSEGMTFIVDRYLSPNSTWSYLRETVEESTSGRQVERSWRITADASKPRHVFVYLQKADKTTSQTENVHILDTFDIGGAKLTSARLDVGGGTYYPETDYSYDDIDRIYSDVIEYSHKEENKDTGSFLTMDRFENIYGMLYFDLTYHSGSLDLNTVQLVIKFRLDQVPGDDYKVYAIILYEESVMVNMVGTEISII